MVCTGHTARTSCSGHVNSCPSHSGYIAPLGSYVFTTPTITTSTAHMAYMHNQLRAAIYYELVRRGKGWTDPGVLTAGTHTIHNLYIKRLRNAVTSVATWTIPWYLQDAAVNAGTISRKEQYTYLRAQINTFRNQCYCQCNYACTCQCNYSCTCNCNYACTCNCNYCPCNCNYCPCNCNYSCTCNCNYSDERLKSDIIYM